MYILGNGSTDNYTLLVFGANVDTLTKNGDYYIEDLEKALENSNPTITLKDDTTISTVDLERIKKSGKKVTFNYYKGKELIYSYIIDGNKVKSTSSIPTGIKFNSSNKKDILRLANYADGLTASLSKTVDLSNGVKIKLYVSDKYKNETSVTRTVIVTDILVNKIELVSDSINSFLLLCPGNLP